MPNFDCGGGGCRSFSCSSCTDDATRSEYFDVLGSCRTDAEADKIMRERLAKKRAHANALLAENERLRAENERLRAAVATGMHYLKGRYPVPVKEKEVLATMQAALDGAKGEKP